MRIMAALECCQKNQVYPVSVAVLEALLDIVILDGMVLGTDQGLVQSTVSIPVTIHACS